MESWDTGRKPSEQTVPKIIIGGTEVIASTDMVEGENAMSKTISRPHIGSTLELLLADFVRRKKTWQ